MNTPAFAVAEWRPVLEATEFAVEKFRLFHRDCRFTDAAWTCRLIFNGSVELERLDITELYRLLGNLCSAWDDIRSPGCRLPRATKDAAWALYIGISWMAENAIRIKDSDYWQTGAHQANPDDLAIAIKKILDGGVDLLVAWNEECARLASLASMANSPIGEQAEVAR